MLFEISWRGQMPKSFILAYNEDLADCVLGDTRYFTDQTRQRPITIRVDAGMIRNVIMRVATRARGEKEKGNEISHVWAK